MVSDNEVLGVGLIIASGTHGVTSDNIDLDAGFVLVIDDSSIGLTSESPTFTQHHILTIANGTSSIFSDMISLGGLATPGIANISHQSRVQMISHRKRGVSVSNQKVRGISTSQAHQDVRVEE